MLLIEVYFLNKIPQTQKLNLRDFTFKEASTLIIF